MAHLKRTEMPMFWPLPRKGAVFATRPSPGPHAKSACIPLQVILRDCLGLARTRAEAKRILNSGAVLVDRQVRTDRGFPVGFMDTVEIPSASLAFRVTVDEHGLALAPIPAAEAGTKHCRVQGKRTLKKGATAISLHDGRTILLDGKAEIRVGDAILISLPDQTIQKRFAIKEGAAALVYAGRNKGAVGTITAIRNRTSSLEKSTVTLETAGGPVETLRSYVIPGEFAPPAKPAKTPRSAGGAELPQQKAKHDAGAGLPRQAAPGGATGTQGPQPAAGKPEKGAAKQEKRKKAADAAAGADAPEPAKAVEA